MRTKKKYSNGNKKLSGWAQQQNGGEKGKNKFETRTVEITQSEQHREKKLNNDNNNNKQTYETYGSITKDLTFGSLRFQKERKIRIGLKKVLKQMAEDSPNFAKDMNLETLEAE